MAGGWEGTDTLRLVMVLGSAEQSEQIANHLRNGGVAVRAVSPQTLQEFQNTLSQPVDLVVCDSKQTELSYKRLAHTIGQYKKHIPVVALLDTFDEHSASAALHNGASAVAPLKSLPYIERVLRNEWSNTRARHTSLTLTEQLQESNKRCDGLIDSSRDAIAYIHQGMHIRTNSAYLQFFGLEDFDEAEGIALLDLIAKEHVPLFKSILKQQDTYEKNQSIQIKVKTPEKDDTLVNMEISPALYEDEKCWQVLVRIVEENKNTSGREDPTTGCLVRGAFLDDGKSLCATGAVGIVACTPQNFNQLFQSLPLSAADQMLAGFAQHLLANLDPTFTVGRLKEATFALVYPLADGAVEQVMDMLSEKFEQFVVSTAEHSFAMPIKMVGLPWHNPSTNNFEDVVSEVIKKLEHATQTVQKFEVGQIMNDQEHYPDLSKFIDAVDNKRLQILYAPINALHGSSFAFFLTQITLHDQQSQAIDIPTNLPQNLEQQWRDIQWDALLQSLSQQHITPNTKILLPVSLGEQFLCDKIPQQLSAAQLPTQLFVFELQEHELLTKMKNAQDTARLLKSMGIEIGLGGFGNSEQSVAVMRNLNPQWVRFNRILTRGLASSSEQQKKLKDLVDNAQDYGSKVIASEIEEARSMAVIFSANVEYAQGDFLSPPSWVIHPQ